MVHDPDPDELGLKRDDPAWLARPAIGRLNLTSPHDDAAFQQFNRHRRHDDKSPPGNFGLVAYPAAGALARTGVRVLGAPLSRDPPTLDEPRLAGPRPP